MQREITNLRNLCSDRGATDDEISLCRPRRRSMNTTYFFCIARIQWQCCNLTFIERLFRNNLVNGAPDPQLVKLTLSSRKVTVVEEHVLRLYLPHNNTITYTLRRPKPHNFLWKSKDDNLVITRTCRLCSILSLSEINKH